MADPDPPMSVDDRLREIEELMKRIQVHIDAIRAASAPNEPLLISALLKVTEEVTAKRGGSDAAKLRTLLVSGLVTDPEHSDVSEATIQAAAEQCVPVKDDGEYDLDQVASNLELLVYHFGATGVDHEDAAGRMNRLPGVDKLPQDKADAAVERGADRAKTK